jgi:hypothetical protein
MRVSVTYTEITYVDMPYALPDVVTTWACTRFGGALASELDPSVLLQIPDTFRKQTCCNQVEEARRDDEKDL